MKNTLEITTEGDRALVITTLPCAWVGGRLYR
jgi:hypothetical protein